MNIKEKINLIYIDDNRDEAISSYLEEDYQNDNYDVVYQEIEFESDKGYESLLDSPEVASANVIPKVVQTVLKTKCSLKNHYSAPQKCPFYQHLDLISY